MKREKKDIAVHRDHIAFYKFLSNKLAVISLIILFLLIAVSILAPILTPYEYDSTDLFHVREAPGKLHLLGTDSVGRDVLTRILYGGRVSLLVGVCAMLIQLFLGTILGAFAGYFGGIIDMIISRIADMVMCFPFYVIAMSIIAVIGRGTFKLIIVIGVLSWCQLFRIVRSEITTIKGNDYVIAAKAMGMSSKEIVIKHLIPNIISPIIVSATLTVASGILLESAMSFLGLGVQPPLASWGNMLSEAQSMSVIANNWWLWMPPGIMIALTVLAINFVGEGLRDALDPRQ